MKVIILSEQNAIRLASIADMKTSIISIVGKDAENVHFPYNKNIDKIFRMNFHDLVTDFKIDDDVMPAPVQSDFTGLKNFIDNLDCKLLIVHCGAGQSRSAAVAAAISDYLNLNLEIFGNPKYSPNPTVYKCCLNEFGIAKTEEYYEDIFKQNAFLDVDIDIEL